MRISTFVFSAVGLMIQLYADYYREIDLNLTLKELENDYGLPRIKTWDFIIVGGGTAGCLIAERLSEHFTVLLLEEGGEPVPSTYNGRMSIDVYNSPAINTLFLTTPQSYSYLRNNGIGVLQSGRMLGGSGSHNANIYSRCSPLDYDNWANMTGDESWRYERMVKHFKQYEDFTGSLINESQRLQYYSNIGPFNVQTDTPRYLELWFLAGKELGYPIADPNGYQIPSFTPVEISMRNGVRESGFTAFIQRMAKNRASLTILRYSTVGEILINEKGEAYGVAYLRHGIPQISHARREVIVTAGPFGSPALLVKSGIGPEGLLAEAGIPLVSSVPGVLQNFMDHLLLTIPFTVTNVEIARYWLHYFQDSEIQKELYKFQQPIKTGVFIGNVGPDTQAMFVSSRAQAAGQWNWPDIQIGLSNDFKVEPNPRTITIFVSQGRVQSKGEILFNATAYRLGEREDSRLISPDPRYFQDPSDLHVYVEAVKFALSILETTTPFQRFGLILSDNIPTNCQNLAYRSDEYWACYIMNNARTAGHRCGTCKMGRITDLLAVVDSNFRVRGVQRLRVCDSSIFPEIPNSNVNAPTLVTAQKAAEEIVKDYSHLKRSWKKKN